MCYLSVDPVVLFVCMVSVMLVCYEEFIRLLVICECRLDICECRFGSKPERTFLEFHRPIGSIRKVHGESEYGVIGPSCSRHHPVFHQHLNMTLHLPIAMVDTLHITGRLSPHTYDIFRKL